MDFEEFHKGIEEDKKGAYKLQEKPKEYGFEEEYRESRR